MQTWGVESNSMPVHSPHSYLLLPHLYFNFFFAFFAVLLNDFIAAVVPSTELISAHNTADFVSFVLFCLLAQIHPFFDVHRSLLASQHAAGFSILGAIIGCCGETSRCLKLQCEGVVPLFAFVDLSVAPTTHCTLHTVHEQHH